MALWHGKAGIYLTNNNPELPYAALLDDLLQT